MRTHGALACVLALQLSVADAQQLVKAAGVPPFPDEYAVYEDRVQQGTYLVAPLRMQFLVDPQTKRPKFGVQYFSEAGKKTTRLSFTGSIRFEFDREKLDSISEWARKQRGPQAKIGIMGGASSECSTFVVLPGSQLVLSGPAKSDITFDSTVQISGSFDFNTKDALLGVLKGSGTIGVYCKTIHKPVSDLLQDLSLSPEILVAIFKSQGWLKIDSDLDAVSEQIISSQAALIPIQYRVLSKHVFVEWFKNFIGLPIPRDKTFGGTEWGWDLGSDKMLKRLKANGALNLLSLDKLTYIPQRFGVTSLENICANYPSHILNIDDGSGGCDGLK